MACGLPVIASHGSSLPEVVEDGVTGLLCPRDDVEAFAKAVRMLAGDSDLAARMAVVAPAVARRCFNHEAMVDAYLNTYQRTR